MELSSCSLHHIPYLTKHEFSRDQYVVSQGIYSKDRKIREHIDSSCLCESTGYHQVGNGNVPFCFGRHHEVGHVAALGGFVSLPSLRPYLEPALNFL